ncbi:SusC/RagA family TonB-linked outer membrane protein [Phocaeicola sp.]
MVVSFIGMKSQELAIKPNLNISLKPDTETLDEVIVVAYGTAKKSSFTGSASSIKADKLEARVVSNVTNALSGQVAGVQSMSTNGQPGKSAKIRIRGIGSMSSSNDPLYVVDGVPYDGDIASINPADIENMTVLKDAAANAIYGARGANGVILITTKSGQQGEAKITVDAKWGSNKRAVPNYDVMTSPAQYYETMYRALYNAKAYNGSTAEEAHAYANKNLLDTNNGGLGYQVYTVPNGQNLIGTDFKLNPNATLGYSDGEYYYTPDNWYDEIFGKGNLRQEYNITVSGKTDKLSYFASAGYLDDSGIIDNSSFTRYTGRGKVDYQAKSWLKVGTNIAYTYQNMHSPESQDNWGSSGNLFYVTNLIAPIYPMYVRNPDGTLAVNSSTGNLVYDNGSTSTNSKRAFMNMARPAGNIAMDRYNTYTDAISGKWYAIITPLEGLSLTANIAANVSNDRTNNLYSRWGGSNTTSDGSTYVKHERDYGINTQYLASYIHTFAEKHNIDLLVGYELYKYKNQLLSGTNDHLYDPFIGELNNAGGTSNKKAESYTDNYMTEGILSRVQYNYDGKYFLSASYRRDASSRFSKDNRWGNFGSIGGAWLMTQENFMKGLKWIDMLKAKVSWGVQGNDHLLMTLGGVSYNNWYAYQDQFKVTYSEDTKQYSLVNLYKGNKDLTWETSYAFNAGIDFELFGSRLNGTIEYFSRKTVDLLYNQPVPLSSGISIGSIPQNVGSIMNKGIEIDLNGVIIRNKNFEWDMNFNLTHYSNKITDLADNVKETGIKGSSYIYEIGGSLYESYLKSYAGVDKTTGSALYYIDPDNGDYETTDDWSKAQLAHQGNTLPKVYGGLGTSLSAYGFDFSIQMAYQLGGRIYDGTYQAIMHTGFSSMAGTNWSKDILKAWTPENPNTDVPRLCASDNSYQLDSNRFLTSSDYLSLNNITLGYTLPKKWMRAMQISNLRLYVTADNLAVLSARKGLDPRMSLGTGSSTTSGNYTYSPMRTIAGGLTVTF